MYVRDKSWDDLWTLLGRRLETSIDAHVERGKDLRQDTWELIEPGDLRVEVKE